MIGGIPIKKIGLILFCVFVSINLIILNFWTINSAVSGSPRTVAESPPPTPINKTEISDTVCSQSCIDKIQEATASFTMIAPTPSVKAGPSPTLSTGESEFIISFGSGSNQTGDWSDVAGLETFIDSTKYHKIKSVTFEGYLSIPTGNETAYGRLFDKTDQHPVWFSDISLGGGTPQLLVSKPIILDAGRKLYQVQMKTSLQFQAQIYGAKIRIISE